MFLSRPSVHRQHFAFAPSRDFNFPVNTSSQGRPRERHRAYTRWISSWRRLKGGLVGEYRFSIALLPGQLIPRFLSQLLVKHHDAGTCARDSGISHHLRGCPLLMWVGVGWSPSLVLVTRLCRSPHSVPENRLLCRQAAVVSTFNRLPGPLLSTLSG